MPYAVPSDVLDSISFPLGSLIASRCWYESYASGMVLVACENVDDIPADFLSGDEGGVSACDTMPLVCNDDDDSCRIGFSGDAGGDCA